MAIGDSGFKIWEVGWDNPVVGDTAFDLPVAGAAQRVGNAWRYDNFDLEAEWTAFGGPFSETEVAQATWPQLGGNYDTFLAWEMHGLRLQPRLTGSPIEALAVAQAVRDDCKSGPLPYKDVGYFQLKPDVALVPIRVVVFHPTPASGSFPPEWVSSQDAELLFDDTWIGEKSATNGPRCSPDAVDGFWKYRAGCQGSAGCETVVQANGSASSSIIQPDRVWDQCGVQFRMVSFHECAIDAREFNPIKSPDDGFCGALGITARMNTLILRARQCGVPDDPSAVIQVMFVGRLAPADCFDVPVGAQNAGSVALTLASYRGSGFVLSHELGHRLGLPDLSDCSSGMLMCEFANSQGSVISDDHCETANKTAMGIQEVFWGAP